MSKRSFPDLLHGLAEVIDSPATGEGGAMLRTVVKWAETIGALVEESERSIVIRLPQDDREFALSLNIASVLDGEPASDFATEFAAAVNTGALTREIDAAVGWDPELAV